MDCARNSDVGDGADCVNTDHIVPKAVDQENINVLGRDVGGSKRMRLG